MMLYDDINNHGGNAANLCRHMACQRGENSLLDPDR